MHSSARSESTDLFSKAVMRSSGQFLGLFPRIFIRGVVLPLNEVLLSASFHSFCDNTLDFVNTHNNWAVF